MKVDSAFEVDSHPTLRRCIFTARVGVLNALRANSNLVNFGWSSDRVNVHVDVHGRH